MTAAQSETIAERVEPAAYAASSGDDGVRRAIIGGIVQELDGHIALAFDPEFAATGLPCRIRRPLSANVSVS